MSHVKFDRCPHHVTGTCRGFVSPCSQQSAGCIVCASYDRVINLKMASRLKCQSAQCVGFGQVVDHRGRRYMVEV
jgi:hypothetical protein